MSTKEKIKQSALTLFNEGDSFSVTTNHIAKDAGISPGNLYYHYRNKEAIILDIFQDMKAEFDATTDFEAVLESSNPIKSLFMMFEKHGAIFWKYLFIKRDVPILIRMDESLKTQWIELQTMRIGQIRHLIHMLCERGIFIALPPNDIDLQAKLSWFIGAYWQVFSSTLGELTPQNVMEGKEILMRLIIVPYLTEKGQELLQDIDVDASIDAMNNFQKTT